MISWKRAAVAVPSVGVALLPKLACPMCWPAYAGMLSALGLGFLISGTYLFWFTAIFLSIFIASLTFRASHRRGFGPAVLGVAATAMLLIAKFQLDSVVGVYASLVLLIGASVWNSWPQPTGKSCPRCPSPTGSVIQFNGKETKL